MKNAIVFLKIPKCTLIGIALNLYITLGSIAIWQYLFFQSKNTVYLTICVTFDFFHQSLIILPIFEYLIYSLGKFIPGFRCDDEWDYFSFW